MIRAVAAAAVVLALAAAAAHGGDAPASPPQSLLSDPGTGVLGMGLLRVAPTTPGAPATVRLRYSERPTDYVAFEAIQLVAFPAEAFAAQGRAFADRALAFARSKKGDYAVEATLRVAAPTLVVVGYGPFEGPDAGRPLTLARTVSLEVIAAIGANWRWVDAEVGELNLKAWTRHPTVTRGGPVHDPVARADHWFEARPLVLYDAARIRAPGDADSPVVEGMRREATSLLERAKAQAAQGRPDAAKELEAEAKDLLAQAAAADDRLPLPAALAERLQRPPLRWK